MRPASADAAEGAVAPLRRRRMPVLRFFESLRFRVTAVAALVFALASAVVLSVTVFALWSATADRVADEARAVTDRVALDLASDGVVGPAPWEPSVPMRLTAATASGSRVIVGRIGVDAAPRDSAPPVDGVDDRTPGSGGSLEAPDDGSGAAPGDQADAADGDAPPSGDDTGDVDAEDGNDSPGKEEEDVSVGPDTLPDPVLPEASYTVSERRPEGSTEGFVRVSRAAVIDGEVWDVEVTATLSTQTSTINVFSTLATRSVPALVLAFALLVWLMVGAALRQVEHVRSAAEAMSGAGSGQRLPLPATGDELHRLTETVNRLLDRIDSARADQQQFISDASHELRSPISTIRTLCEVAQAHPDRSPTPELAARVDVEAQRLDLLVADLLELARLTEGQSATVSEVDLDELVFTEVSRVPEGVSVDTSGVSPVRALGSERRWSMVVRNLIGNAGRYADSRVWVSLSCGEPDEDLVSVVRLMVDDDGPGVPLEERERVFGRFVRLDEGRARDAGGTGLGLAVVSDVVAAMGGSRHVTDSGRLGGARFVVEVPVHLADDGLDDLECFDEDGED